MLNIPDQNGIFHNCSCQTSSIFDPFAGISQFVCLAIIHEKRSTTPSILYNSVGFVLIINPLMDCWQWVRCWIVGVGHTPL
ncbi:hypothetical protein T06_7428 [Trichinella sp. T6]|nr:hypothetical protein T06_7428 [Trichinella sp. T6]